MFQTLRLTIILSSFVVVFLLLQQFALLLPANAAARQSAFSPSTDVVISQVYGGGGNSGASYRNDYIELFNRGASPVNISGWSVQYGSAANNLSLKTDLTGTIQPGAYFLIQEASGGSTGSFLPNPDIPNGAINMSATVGKVALVTNGTILNCGAAATPCPMGLPIKDYVGFGTTASTFEGTGPAASPSSTTAAFRKGGGCNDFDDNANDFSVAAAGPRNSSTPVSVCGGSSNPFGTGFANPSTVLSGANTLLTVSVSAGTDPASSGMAVSSNLSSIGGAQFQNFFDNGTNGDVSAGDNVFSFQLIVTADGGNYQLPFTVSDAESRTSTSSISLTVGSTSSVHLTMGNPSNAVTDVNSPGNYLLEKPQFVMSYHRDRGIPNWVSWHLDSSWLGSAPRQDDFRPDTSLPAGWYQVQPSDYTGSGFDRGHHTPSGDRTSSVANNSATFLMTNMMPQSADNNQGPWEKLETYCRTLVNQGSEIYIIGGSVGQGGTGLNGFKMTIGGGHVVVPSQTWKVVIILTAGTGDVSRVTPATQTIGVIMPNTQGIRTDTWQQYLVTVDQVEALTGHDYFSNVSVPIQGAIESRLFGSPPPSPTPTPTATPTPTPTPADRSISGTVSYGTTPAGQPTKFVPDVLLAATGAAPVNAATDVAGAYLLSGLGEGSYTVTPSKSGDVNGISALDASRVAQHAAGLIVLTPNQIFAGDATNNGTLSALDASRIAQFAAGITNPGTAGQWKFVAASRSYAGIADSMSNENYEAILVGDVTGNWAPPQAAATINESEPEFSDTSNSSLVDHPIGNRNGHKSADVIHVDLPATATTEAGRALTLPIPISDTTGKGAVAYEFTLEFDANVLSPLLESAGTVSTLSSGWSVIVNSEVPGRITVIAYSTQELTGAGTLLNLNFSVNRASGGITPLKWTRFEINENEVLSDR